MSNLDELQGYWKKLEGNMEIRLGHLDDGGFLCDGVCDKSFDEDDIKHLKDIIKSFKGKSNKAAKAFNELFETNFIPYPKNEDLEWDVEKEEFVEPVIEPEPEEM